MAGSWIPICRPTHFQRSFYNGKEKEHGIKYQGIEFPDGIMGHLFGPCAGRHHDAWLLVESNLMADLDRLFRGEQRRYHIYGDYAYPCVR